ncbi:ATP-binding protein [Streptomyces ochraceiscleroticus]|uniref:histidine kinase n=1 Tax=Streptomyces ochraceiscleroticus TaxID=47761 RepID=A0ABW1MP16_9ACTN|nr:ATP-binding protein [Streptomyces ochraceiscleroticus]
MTPGPNQDGTARRSGTAPDYHALFDAAPSPYLVLDPELRIVEVNRAYLAATHTERQAILGRPVFEVFPDNPGNPAADGVRNLAHSLRTVLATGRPDTMALQRYDIPDGTDGAFEERYWSPVNSPVLDGDGRLTHIVHRVEDVTEFVRLRRAGQRERRAAAAQQERAERMESELFARSREVQEANQRLRQANEALTTAGVALREQQEAKDRFIATLSHELRNPLAALRAAGELLALDAPDAAHPALAVLERQITHMARMTDDLLDATRALTGRLHLASERLDLCSVVTTAAEDMLSEYARTRRRLLVVVPSGPVPVEGDRVRLAQMTANLLSNGCKYTRPNGTVELELETVAGSGAAEAGHAVLTVRDDGIGFDPATADALFGAFVRAAPAADTTSGGLGLGLPIVRGIAELHGGTVRAHSDGPGSGAHFRIRLPLASPAPVPRSGAPAAAVSRPPLRVLVIEDNADLAATYRTLLERCGDHVTVCHTGREGLAAAHAAPFDLVLSDLALPDIHGHDLAGRLRAEFPADRTRLIAVSGFSRRADRDRSAGSGFDAHLAKPLSLTVLNRLLARWAGDASPWPQAPWPGDASDPPTR